jgi:protein-L-isoaspartate(D-aspartate) O-methyltransferase
MTITAEQTRSNMIEQQIRPWNVLDMQVLDLLRKVKREQFAPAALAFMDIEIPLGHGAAMWTPKVEARVVQALELTGTEQVLEVGSGSGYLTALLARLAKRVTSVEIVPELHALARKNLAACHVNNVDLHLGDAAREWPGSYDVVVLTGSVPVVPDAHLMCLKPKGRLFAFVGDAPAMEAELITREANGNFSREFLFEGCIAPLQNAVTPERFVF